MHTAEGQIIAVEQDTGRMLWRRYWPDVYLSFTSPLYIDGKLYYSSFFGYAASQRKRRGLPEKNNGLTARMDPKTGEVVWLTTDYYVTSKCTISARDGRLYIGGFNRDKEGTDDRFVWCLSAKDGSLIWQSDPVTSALNVITVGEKFIFSNALRGKGNVFDRQTGKLSTASDTTMRAAVSHFRNRMFWERTWT